MIVNKVSRVMLQIVAPLTIVIYDRNIFTAAATGDVLILRSAEIPLSS